MAGIVRFRLDVQWPSGMRTASMAMIEPAAVCRSRRLPGDPAIQMPADHDDLVLQLRIGPWNLGDGGRSHARDRR